MRSELDPRHQSTGRLSTGGSAWSEDRVRNRSSSNVHGFLVWDSSGLDRKIIPATAFHQARAIAGDDQSAPRVARRPMRIHPLCRPQP
jgi:K+-transporting ATPase c subunit